MTDQQWTFDPSKAATEMILLYSAETDRVATSAMEENNKSAAEQSAVAPDVVELGNHDNHGSIGGDVDPVSSYLNWSQGNGGSPAKKRSYVDGQHSIFERPSNERVTVATGVQVPSNHDNHGSVGGVGNSVNSYPNWPQRNEGSTANERPFMDRIFKKPPVDMDETEDDSYQFLLSLWPYLRQIPKHRKLVVRHKLQKVLIDEENTVYVAYSNVPTSTSTICDNNCHTNVPVPPQPRPLVTETHIDHQRPRHHRQRHRSANNETSTVIGPPNVDISATYPYINNYTNQNNIMTVNDQSRQAGQQPTRPFNNQV